MSPRATPTTPLTRLLDGEDLDAPPALGEIEAVELLDFMADLNHGPIGSGPGSPGATFSLRVLGHYLQGDPEGLALLSLVRRATAYESPAERRAPSAVTAREAAEALDLLSRMSTDPLRLPRWVATVLPTPMHARYALSLLAEGGAVDTELFDRIAEHLERHDESGEDDRAFVERLRTR
ncbi:MAG: hypothetical protein AAGE94_02160 [Acidobacteriota bacterium]